MIVGDNVRVLTGAQKHLADRGYVADYMTAPVDGIVGKIVGDYLCVVEYPHLAVDLGFEFPVGIPKEFLARLDETCQLPGQHSPTPLMDEEESRQAKVVESPECSPILCLPIRSTAAFGFAGIAAEKLHCAIPLAIATICIGQTC